MRTHIYFGQGKFVHKQHIQQALHTQQHAHHIGHHATHHTSKEHNGTMSNKLQPLRFRF